MLDRIRRAAAAVVLASSLGFPANAATLPYSEFHAFGDSLTDNGNAYDLSFGFAPETPPYYRGRFSDGPIWYDRVARVFRKQGAKTRNYAIGGARAATNFDFIPDLRAQRRLFRARANPEPSALAAVFGGGNDLLARIGRARLKRNVREAADAVVATAASLHRNGIDTTLVFNLPNFADIPRYADSSPLRREQAASASARFNRRLARGVADLRASGRDVIEVDTFGLFADVVANPGAYGIDNLTRPCLEDGRNRCTEQEARRTAFFDKIHPSGTLHRILGDHVLDLLAPLTLTSLLDGANGPAVTTRAVAVDGPQVAAVPLPGPALLLIGAAGMLSWVARRRPGLSARR